MDTDKMIRTLDDALRTAERLRKERALKAEKIALQEPRGGIETPGARPHQGKGCGNGEEVSGPDSTPAPRQATPTDHAVGHANATVVAPAVRLRDDGQPRRIKVGTPFHAAADDE